MAAAGTGKTSAIVNTALQIDNAENILITTFTLNNVSEIKRKIIECKGIIPENITVIPWFSFLLHELVRPYQNAFHRQHRTNSLTLVSGRSAMYIPKSNPDAYFFGNTDSVYSDKIAELALICNESSKGSAINRLEQITDHLFIDEVQDLAGYDLELLMLFLEAKFSVCMVGDYRQATLATNQSPKHKKYRYGGIINLFEAWKDKGRCELEYATVSHRCCEPLCKFSDLIFPEAPGTKTSNNEVTGHDGIFLVRSCDLNAYMAEFSPQVLRNDKRNKCAGLPAMNFRISKGLTFQRNLIFPTAAIKKYLETGDITKIKDKETFYVAVTRARQSVAFVYDGDSKISDVTVYTPR